MNEMPAYIGTKIVCATPMDEVTFLREHRGAADSDRDTRPGYMVVYPDGYKSWAPEDVLEGAYRLVTEDERRFVV